MPYTARPYVLHEASYRQLLDLKPNLAVLPWGATEAHNFHLPYGTDTIEATAMGERVVERANAQGARCVLLPTIPFGNNNQQLTQVATVTMRTATQILVLRDVADSLVKQGIDRLVILNFHGGNEFKQIMRDVMLDVPIFIAQVHGWNTDPKVRDLLDVKDGTHADEFETSLLMHLTPGWVDLPAADKGEVNPYKLKKVLSTPGMNILFEWASIAPSSGVGDPSKSTAAKGEKMLGMLVEALVPALVELSQAKEGDSPFFIRRWE
jgi:creatinine amidohydrolase